MPALNMATDTQLVYRDVLLSRRSRGVTQEFINVGTETVHLHISIFFLKRQIKERKKMEGFIKCLLLVLATCG